MQLFGGSALPQSSPLAAHRRKIRLVHHQLIVSQVAISTPHYAHGFFESSMAQEFRSQWATNLRREAESTFVSGYISAKRRVNRGNAVASTVSRFAVSKS